MADSGRMRGWKYDHEDSHLEVWVNGTNVGVWDDANNDLVRPTNGLTITAGGATVTAGDLTVTAGDAHVVAQNLYMGAETAFATTEPTSAIIFKQGTQAAGAIVTSTALMANATVLRKIIADGTISNVES